MPMIREAALTRWGHDHEGQMKQTVSRHRLEPMDMIDYEMLSSGDELFLKVAAICCNLGRFPRKELHESFSAAVMINDYFPNQSVIVDGAAGHGLVGLILLLLNSSRVCLAVDRERPRSSLLLTEAFDRTWPGLTRRHRYVEGDLNLVTPPCGSLLVSVHGCGSLSDLLLAKAIESSCALTLIPCCQSGSQYRLKKREPLILFKHHPMTEEAAALHTERMAQRFSVPLAVDAARVASLRTLGYQVKIQKLPDGISGRSRVILASKSSRDPHLSAAANIEALSTCWPERKLPESPWTAFKTSKVLRVTTD